MDYDNSLAALMNPGEADNFFDIENLPPFDPIQSGMYNRTNALWLMEFCRLIYRQERDEIPSRPADFKSRNDFLTSVGWKQAPGDFFNKEATQAALFTNQQLSCAVFVARGTLGLRDTFMNLEAIPVPWDGPGLVHLGFLEALNAIWRSLHIGLMELPTQ